MPLHKDVEFLAPLVGQLLELSNRSSEQYKKRLWADHQALLPTDKIPVCVYYEGIPAVQWDSIFGSNHLKCADPLARSIEFDLKRRIWMAKFVPDDHIVWNSIAVSAPRNTVRGWGVDIQWSSSGDPLGARGYKPPFENRIDLTRLTEPLYDINSQASNALKDKATELTQDRLQVFLQYPTMGYAPFDLATSMRGMTNLMMDIVECPEQVKQLMDFLTGTEVAYEKQRERLGWLNVFADETGVYQQVGFRVHCAYLHENFSNRKPLLEDEWTYLSQQTSAGLGSDQYAEFVQPSNVALASMFPQKTVYYHGCECLDQKLSVLAATPHLRRFHVSPWSSVPRARDVFRGNMVLEVHDHPGKVFFGATPDEIRSHLNDLVREAERHPMDVNISDIHSFNGRPELLTLWAQIAQEVALQR